MGLKPSQGELNVALKPIFARINNVHLIHDNVIIATKNMSHHTDYQESNGRGQFVWTNT